MSDQKSYAPPPNMYGPQDTDNKFNGGHPSQAGYAPQPGFAPYGYPSNNVPPSNLHVPNQPDTDPIVKGFEFSTESIRRGFIRKVYAILSVQLSFTFLVVMLFAHHYPTRIFAFQNFWLFIVSMVMVFVTIITLSCCEGVRRTSPSNMIFLALFTVGESICVGYATLSYPPDVVMIAIGATAVVVISLTIFAMQTKWDFTVMGGVLFVALMLFVVFSFVLMFTRSEIAHLIFAGIGALLFSIYLIYDTQMIMGGNHKYSMSPEEYVLGSITLFLDIINIFLYILRIVGAATKN
ncbi:protein lifeguard 1-like [Contarinia nasturtii]|uniref:protein lifeguard 1-like n=1 Tax=Contarinia nasturtii TaxID=265458 RepID=UPI0012D3CDE2|nr:protein lifeguard 1-like [Contarinia nasturtii]